MFGELAKQNSLGKVNIKDIIKINPYLMKPTITINTFHRQYLNAPNPKNKSKSDISINFIIYTPNKKLLFLDKFIKDKQKSMDDISYSKSTKLQALTYALSNATPGVPTYCIIDQQVSQQIMKAFLENSQATKNKEFYKLVVFYPQIEKLPKNYFGIPGLDLITSCQEKVVEFVEEKLDVGPVLKSQLSTSSINSTDFKKVHMQFEEENQMKNISSPDQKEQQQENLIVQMSPGYKYNNSPEMSKKGAVMDRKSKQSDPKQWSHTESTFAKFQTKQ